MSLTALNFSNFLDNLKLHERFNTFVQTFKLFIGFQIKSHIMVINAALFGVGARRDGFNSTLTEANKTGYIHTLWGHSVNDCHYLNA